MAYHGTYNAFLMDLPESSFVIFADSEGVDLAVSHDGFPSYWKSSVFFIVATLIAVVLFEQFLIRNAV